MTSWTKCFPRSEIYRFAIFALPLARSCNIQGVGIDDGGDFGIAAPCPISCQWTAYCSRIFARTRSNSDGVMRGIASMCPKGMR
jgi:hypothetical protein